MLQCAIKTKRRSAHSRTWDSNIATEMAHHLTVNNVLWSFAHRTGQLFHTDFKFIGWDSF